MERIYLESVDSTNKWAKENIENIADFSLVYTYNQTAGRGRMNREWNNLGTDNIYASIVLKPSKVMKTVYSNLTQYLCVVLAKTLEEYGVKTQIKWPNDVKINGKKICGILAEAVQDSTELKGIVLGFGVNLNADKLLVEKINQPATALNIETGRYVDKEVFLKKLSGRFCLLYDKFIEEGFLLIKNDYIQRAYFLNNVISVKVFDRTVTGRAIGITDDGALKIIDSNNNEQILLIGDIL